MFVSQSSGVREENKGQPCKLIYQGCLERDLPVEIYKSVHEDKEVDRMKQWSEREFLQQDIWYHATEDFYVKDILKDGVIADINADVELDFGFGFYLTPSFDWAKKYSEGYSAPRILEYHFTPESLLESDSTYKFFGELNTEFAEFVFNNRMYFEKYDSKCVHTYDFVGGVMSDGNQPVDFERFRNGLISKEELFRRICIPKEDWQIVIHSQTMCNKLKKPFAIHDLKGGIEYADR